MKSSSNKIRYIFYLLSALAIGWLVLTLYVESNGPAREWTIGVASEKKVLVVFDPDPFYNLDEKVCLSLAKGIAENGISVSVMTVSAAERARPNNYNVFVFCANTYNWRPDWSITNYIQHQNFRDEQHVIAVTLGAGSTEAAKKNFEGIINNSGEKLLNSYTLWLWRPNDETKMEESNVEVAEKMAHQWGVEIGIRMNKKDEATEALTK